MPRKATLAVFAALAISTSLGRASPMNPLVGPATNEAAKSVDVEVAAATQAAHVPIPQGTGFGFSVKPSIIVGSEGYVYSDFLLSMYMPGGIDLSAEAGTFHSDSSTATPTITFGGGKGFGPAYFFGSYALTLRSEGFESNATDIGMSYKTSDPDFRTTWGADVRLTHYTQFFPKSETLFSQRTPTFSLKQQIYDTRITADLSESVYNKNILAITTNLNRRSNLVSLLGNFTGTIQGFPDWVATYGVYHDFYGSIPCTLWGTYQNTHFIQTAFLLTPGATADSWTVGVDSSFFRRALKTTLQYNYVRQTGAPDANYYGASLTYTY